jgi:hypothetical protein
MLTFNNTTAAVAAAAAGQDASTASSQCEGPAYLHTSARFLLACTLPIEFSRKRMLISVTFVTYVTLHCYVVTLLLQVWRSSSFSQRRRLLKILLKYIIAHQQEICRCESVRISNSFIVQGTKCPAVR